MKRLTLSGVILALALGCAPATSDIATTPPKAVGSSAELPLGPHGGQVTTYGKEIFFEVTVDPSGKVFAYPYDQEGNPIEVRNLRLQRVGFLDIRYPPDGNTVLELNRDSERGAFMGIIGHDEARDVQRAANVKFIIRDKVL
jgi:YD repeat-containing protein